MASAGRITVLEGEPSPFSRAMIAGKVFWNPANWAEGFETSKQAIAEGGGMFLIEGFARRAKKTAEQGST